jgi:hypothetical protein
VLFPPKVIEPATLAWTTAGETSVLSLMPRKGVPKNAETHFELNRALDGYNALALAVARAAAYTAQTSDPFHPSRATITPGKHRLRECSLRFTRQAVYDGWEVGASPEKQDLITRAQ